MIRFVLFVLLFSVGLLNGYNQNLFFEELNNAGGPNTSVHGIAKDSLGYIWFGSWDGLYRYNGTTFVNYRKELASENSLPDNRIRNLVSDENQQLWILTFNNQFVKYNYRFNNFSVLPDSMVSLNVQELLQQNSNQINRNNAIGNWTYFLSAHKLIALNINTNARIEFTSDLYKPGYLADDYVTSFYIDKESILWVGTRSGLIYKANTKRKPFFLENLIVHENNRSIAVAIRTILETDEYLWLGTNHNGLYYKSLKNRNSEYVQLAGTPNSIRALLEDQTRGIWIGSTDGLQYYHPDNKEIIEVFNRNLFPDFQISSVFSIESYNNDLLLVGLYDAIAKVNINTKKVEIIDLAEQIDNHSVMDLKLDAKGNLWIACEGNGLLKTHDSNLHQIDQYQNINEREANKISGDRVYALDTDRKGDLWLGSSDGLNRISSSDQSVTTINDRNGLPMSYISGIVSGEDDFVWVSHKAGISKIDINSLSVVNYYLNDGKSNWVFQDGAVFKNHENKIYFGAREGYVSFNPEQISDDSIPINLAFSNLKISGNKVEIKQAVNGDIILSEVFNNTNELRLNAKNSTFSIEMEAVSFQNSGDFQFKYILEGYDESFTTSSYGNASYTKIPSGTYTFIVEIVGSENIISEVKSLKIKVLPVWYLSVWAIISYLLFGMLVVYFIAREVITREKLKSQVLLERVKAENEKELNRSKLQFFTNISHELKTPLTLISEPIKQLGNNTLDENKRNLYLDIANRNIEKLITLINQILDFRKSETGKYIPSYHAVDLVQIVGKSVQEFNSLANKRKISLEFSCKQSSAFGMFDQKIIQQVVSNLLSNALKYTPKGGQVEVALALEKSTNEVELTVSDNGNGIEVEMQQDIFEPFFNEGSKPYFGTSTGIGLALTKNLLDTLNGSIRLQSEVNKGTEITVNWTFDSVSENSKEIANNSKIQSGQPTGQTPNQYLSDYMESNSKPMLAIIEDNQDLQSLLSSELAIDFDLIQAIDGNIGYQLIEDKIPDIIITDVMMPGLDGLELCDQLKNNDRTSHIPVIMLTAKTTEENQVEGLKSGAEIYLTKPFKIEVLKAQIESVLKNRTRIQEKYNQNSQLNIIEDNFTKLDKQFIEKCEDLVQHEIDNISFKPDLLAKHLKISRSQLYRKLTAITGLSPQEFITKLKMEAAVKYLLQSDLNISEIAFKLGFSESSNFSRTFTKFAGCSPLKYRKQNQ